MNPREDHVFGWTTVPARNPAESSYNPRLDNILHPGAFNAGESSQSHLSLPVQDAALSTFPDYAMQVDNEELGTGSLNTRAGHPAPRQPRSKYGHLNWNIHKATIASLYLGEDKTLAETMEIMKRLHAFDASRKLYVAKLKEWGWQKNLPSSTAAVMYAKAKRRKEQDGKDTIFFFGGKTWDTGRVETTVMRAKKVKETHNLDDATTPHGVSYKTPKTLTEFPSHEENDDNDPDHLVVDMSEDDPSSSSSDTEDTESDFGGAPLALTWNGQSRADLQASWDMACRFRDAGSAAEAEEMFRQTLAGMSNVLGKTNEDTLKVAYSLADLYATEGRTREASEVLENIIQGLVEVWGYEHKNTQQNVLKAAELLTAWNRQADALGLLSLAKERLNTVRSHVSTRATHKKGGKGKEVQNTTAGADSSDLARATENVLSNNTTATLSFELGVARKHVALKDEGTENLLMAIISQCDGKPEKLIQCLQARAELLKLRCKLNKMEEDTSPLDDALQLLEHSHRTYDWHEDEVESFEVMEALLQLTANVLQAGAKTEARYMFLKLADTASEVFGSEDERAVWVLISIGLVYQTYMTWNDAVEWFEQAFAAALANEDWGPKDGMVRCLQNALDHRHFSYVSDKGRPFKTVFGVSGLRIMPARLHLE